MRGAEEQASNRLRPKASQGAPHVALLSCSEPVWSPRLNIEADAPVSSSPCFTRTAGCHLRLPAGQRGRVPYHSPKTIGEHVTLRGWPNGRSSYAEHLAATLTRK